MFICQYCGREGKSTTSNIAHEIHCHSNPYRKNKIPSYGMKGKTAWNKGLTKDTDNRVKQNSINSGNVIRRIIANGGGFGFHSPEYKLYMQTDEYRKIQSERMINAVKQNPDSYTKNNVCGRVKIVQYKGCNLKGQWELKVAQWLDAQSIAWEHEPHGFLYIWKDKERKYFPDFYLTEYDIYIEVKGYKTDRDDAKWSCFPKHLIIIDGVLIDNLYKYSIIDLCAYSSVGQ